MKSKPDSGKREYKAPSVTVVEVLHTSIICASVNNTENVFIIDGEW